MKKTRRGILFLSLFLLAGCSVGEGPEIVPEETPSVTESEAVISEHERESIAGTRETDPSSEEKSQSVSGSSEALETSSEPETTVSENIGRTALASVPNYVNVRSGPSTEYEVVGKIFNNCAALILDEVEGGDGNWFLMSSGNVTGYIKSSFFLVGEEAEKLREQVGVKKGIVKEDYLRVRSAPDLTDPDNVFTYYELGTEVIIEELTENGFAKIETDDASTGYVYAECLEIRTEFDTAVTLEEEAEMIRKKEEAEEKARIAEEEYQKKLQAEESARQEAERQRQIWAQQEAERQKNQASQKQQVEEALKNLPPDSDATAALRNAVVTYALQFVGNPYVHGGRSLVTGTDCSGFTSLVYQHFGYMLDYTPAGQANQGIQVALTDLRPGDLLFYSNSQKYLGHVAMYIGNGQIVHAGTEATGILIMSAYYRDPLFARRIIP